MNNFLQKLKEPIVFGPIVTGLVLIVVIILLMPGNRDDNNKADNNSAVLNQEIIDSSNNLYSSENADLLKTVEADRELNEYELSLYNSYDAIIEAKQDNNLKELCAVEIEEEIENVKKEYIFLINDKEYDSRISANTVCNESDEDCHKRSFSLNEIDIKKEIENNQYNLVNGCLYKDGLKVLNYSLNAYDDAGFFVEDVEINVGVNPEAFYLSSEWFRFEHDNKLFIFLKNTAGCGGCAFNGHYLSIDLKTNEIEAKYQAGLYNYFNTILSPDKKHAIVVSWDEPGYKTSLYVYDFINFSEKLIFNVAEDKSILYVGLGTQPYDGAIKWLDNENISLQLFEKNLESSVTGEVHGVKLELNQGNKYEAVKSGEAIKIKVVE